ncbi:hypothetical protein [Gehongia tenuis]|uniref:Uncharacterized protein n=1 Tax=Gehongia tenuis TaxID=2763655 RepID=A0A926D2S5_9FIRM|nr:hypothetical protein [Gehongia tenuis]MBC8530461.1 hypothetical protein [Gehongia tenuis]
MKTEKDKLFSELEALKVDHQSLQGEKDELDKSVKEKDSAYKKLNDEYTQYKKDMEPYAALSIAEADAQKAAAELQAEQDRKALEEQKAQEAAEKAAAKRLNSRSRCCRCRDLPPSAWLLIPITTR